MPPGSTDRERVRELVARCLDQIDERGSGVIEDVCREAPELADSVRRRLATLERAGLVAPVTGNDEAFPDQLGEFKLLRRIGGGGMGVVYLAEQTSLARKVALKLVRPELLYFPGARERFRREVDAIAKLRHPNVVPIYTYSDRSSEGGEGREIPYYAMEWVDGASLDEVLHLLRGRKPEQLTGADLRAALHACRDARAADRLPTDARPETDEPGSLFATTRWVDVCIRMLAPVALALEHAHQQGVIHRDLKPSNLMLTRDGRVLLVDFGLASTRGTTRLTKTGAQLGSLPYTPPEQLERSSDAVDERSDVYSLGVTLYELLTLSPAFGAEDPEFARPATIEETRRAILAGDVRPLRERNPSLSWDAETVCLVAMERDPARRYASAAAFAADLSHVLHRQPIDARRPGIALRLKRVSQRHPVASVAIALVTLALIAVLSVYSWQQHEAKLVAQRGEQRAQKSSQRARGAIRNFLTQVGAVQLQNVPGAEKLREELLEEAVRAYEEIFAEEDTPEVRRELAFALEQLGLREDLLGQIDDARRHLERALDLLEGEGAPPLDSIGARVTHASIVGDLANFEHVRGFDEGNLDRLRRAHGLWEALAREEPTARVRSGWLNSIVSLAMSPELPLEELRAVATRAGELADEVALELPDDPKPRARAASVLLTLGLRERMADDAVTALALMREAARRFQELEREFPGRVEIRAQLLNALLELGQLARTRNLLDEARDSLGNARTVATLLVDNFPAAPDFRTQLGYVDLVRAEVLTDRGEHDAAVEAHRLARDEFASALALAPKEFSALGYSGANERALAALLAGRGDVEGGRDALRRARAALQQAIELRPEDPWHRLELAEARLVVAKHPELATPDDDAPSTSPPSVLADLALEEAFDALARAPDIVDFVSLACEAGALAVARHLEQGREDAHAKALAIVRRLIEHGVLDADHVGDSREFAPLCGIPEFDAVLHELTSR